MFTQTQKYTTIFTQISFKNSSYSASNKVVVKCLAENYTVLYIANGYGTSAITTISLTKIDITIDTIFSFIGDFTH